MKEWMNLVWPIRSLDIMTSSILDFRNAGLHSPKMGLIWKSLLLMLSFQHCCHFNGFNNFWLRSFDTRRETHFLKVYDNHTTLTPPPRAAHLVMFKISTCRNPKNSTARLNGRKLNYFFSKSSNSPDHLFWGLRHLHSSPVSCLGVYYDIWWLSCSFNTRVRLHYLTMHLD